MIKDIQELNFPKLEGQEKSYATMCAATVSLQDMGDKTITSQIRIDGQITPDFSFDWEIVFKGEKYIMPLRQPQGAKENTTLNSLVDLTFQHWAIYQLKRWYFFTVQPVESGTAVADKYIASVSLNLGDFCNLFKIILNYYYGDKITLDLNPKWEYKSEPEVITISYSYLWDVLTKLYEVYAVRWQIEPNGSPDKYVIKVGYGTTEQSHIFEYGFEGGLLKLERRVQDEDIRNMLLGRGGEKNLPYRYFKDVDPENPTFKADPDWIPELRNIYFSELRPKTFRDYVRGWKTNPNRQLTEADGTPITPYPHDNTVQPIAVEPYDEEYAAKSFAYRLGHTDEKFDPVEYVKDDGSIKRYGELLGGLDNNEEIYPSIQGVVVNSYGRIDEAVFVEQIESDDVVEAVENNAQITNIKGATTTTHTTIKPTLETITVDFPEFTVDKGKTANIIGGVTTIKAYYLGLLSQIKNDISDRIVLSEEPTIIVVNVETGETHSASAITEGRWRWSATFKLEMDLDIPAYRGVWVTVGYENPKLEQTTLSDKWTNTFDILVKNIWGTSRQSGETDEQYAKRVWEPILGDRLGNEAKIIFASGALSISEDYEFTIVDIPKYERKLCKWQTVEQGDVVPHEYYSEWRITLAKSDADLETLGTYVPSTMRQGKAGDYLFFVGIDMPFEYVVWAEERVDSWKTDILNEKKDIKPTFVVTTDRVKLNNGGKPDALINKLHIGDTLRLADKRFIIKEYEDEQDEQVYETLYLSSLTYTYREPSTEDAALNPDVEIVLSDSYASAANPVATLQGEVSALAKQVGSISNVEQIVRAVGDKLYLRKDGIPDRSLSPTEFASLVRSLDFRSGIVGGVGWGIYKDENNNWVIEADRFKARNDLEVNNLVINQVVGQGGTVVESAARMEITRVEETNNGYKCYFDQKNGSVANLFHVDDIAWNNRYTPENADLKFYRRRVTEVGVDYVLLSKTDVNGTGIPSEGDVIVQRGNYTDPERRYIKVRDVIGGGYERYIQNLDSVNAEGKEYYFAGRVNGDTPRWLIGIKDADYAEWYKGKLNIKGSISVESVIGDKTLGDIISNIADVDYLTKVFKDRTLIDGGLVLSTLLKMGVNNESFTSQTTYAGISGLYDAKKIGGGIAIWFGGDMFDKADYFDWNEETRQWVQKQGVDITGLRIASGLDRMDGTGYRANGNIWWDNDGKVYADPMSFFVGENTLGNITQLFKFYPGQNMPFADVTHVEPTRPFRNLKIGFNTNSCAEIYYDAEKDCVVITKTILSLGDVQSKRSSEIVGGTGGGSDFSIMSSWNASLAEDPDYVLSAKLGYELYTNMLSRSEAEGLYQPKGDYVTLGGEQTISGFKTITAAKNMGSSGFNVGLQLQNSSHSSIEIVGGKYTMGLGCHSNGYWYWWRGTDTPTTKDNKLYVMAYNGSIFDFYSNSIKAASFVKKDGTSAQFLMADGGMTTKVSATAVTDSGWNSADVDSKKIPDMSFIAYWNGRYNATSSNLAYCNKGAFGDIVTQSLSGLDNRYVNASGDTMTGDLYIYSNDPNAQYRLLGVGYSGGNRAYLHNPAWVGICDAALSLYNSASHLGSVVLSDSGVFYRSAAGVNNTLWHSGNDGSGSGLDADLLDGYHRSNLFNGMKEWIAASGLNRTIEVGGSSDTYYPVIITVDSNRMMPTKISIWKDLGTKTPAISGNHSNGTSSMWLVYEGRRTWWDGNGGFIRTLYRAMPYAELCADAQYNTTVHGGLIVWLRGGGCVYNISCTNPFDATVALSEYSLGTSGSNNYTVAPRTTIGNRGIVNSGIALYGNASSATKLATARNFAIADYYSDHTGAAVPFNGEAAVTLKLPEDVNVRNLVGKGSVTAKNGLISMNDEYGGLYIYGGSADHRARIWARRNTGNWGTDDIWVDIDPNGKSIFYHPVEIRGDVVVKGTILATGDIQSKKASQSIGEVVRIENPADNSTVKIPATASVVILQTSVDGGVITLEIDGDINDVEVIDIYVREFSAGDVTIKYKPYASLTTQYTVTTAHLALVRYYNTVYLQKYS